MYKLGAGTRLKVLSFLGVPLRVGLYAVRGTCCHPSRKQTVGKTTTFLLKFGSRFLLFQSMQADYFDNLPAVGQLLPDNRKSSCFGCGLGFLAVVEFVQAYFNCAIIFNWIYFDAAFYEFARDFPTDVFLRTVYQRLFVVDQTAFVVVKLNIVSVKRSVFFEIFIASVVSPKKGTV